MGHDIFVMLSDCTIAIKPEHDEYVPLLRDRIIRNFDSFRKYFVGTGAPFITLERLRDALSSMGVQVG